MFSLKSGTKRQGFEPDTSAIQTLFCPFACPSRSFVFIMISRMFHRIIEDMFSWEQYFTITNNRGSRLSFYSNDTHICILFRTNKPTDNIIWANQLTSSRVPSGTIGWEPLIGRRKTPLSAEDVFSRII